MVVRRAWLPWLIGVIALLLIVPVVLLALAEPRSTPPPASGSVLHTIEPVVFGAPIDLDTIPMYDLDSRLVGDKAALSVGFASGRTTGTIPLPRDGAAGPVVSALSYGRFAYALNRRDGTEVSVVSVDSGGARRVPTPGADVIEHLVIDAKGQWVYYVAMTRVAPQPDTNATEGPSTGVWRVRTDGSADPERVMPPYEPTTSDERWRQGIYVRSQLFLSAEGASLVAVDCADAGPCRLRVLDLASGRINDLSQVAKLPTSPSGLIGRALLVPDACETCLPQAVSIDTGARREIGQHRIFSAVLLQSSGALAYIDNDERQAGRTQLHMIDLVSGRDVLVMKANRAYWPDDQQRIELPAGWMLLSPEPCFPPPPDRNVAVVNLASGDVVPLRWEMPAPMTCQG